MAKKLAMAVVFEVELTQYGWRVKEDSVSHGLFVSKDKALSLVKARQGMLDRPSSIVLIGTEPKRSVAEASDALLGACLHLCRLSR